VTLAEDDLISLEYDQQRQVLVIQQSATGGDGWHAKVQAYLRTLETDTSVSKDMDLIVWWQVRV